MIPVWPGVKVTLHSRVLSLESPPTPHLISSKLPAPPLEKVIRPPGFPSSAVVTVAVHDVFSPMCTVDGSQTSSTRDGTSVVTVVVAVEVRVWVVVIVDVMMVVLGGKVRMDVVVKVVVVRKVVVSVAV